MTKWAVRAVSVVLMAQIMQVVDLRHPWQCLQERPHCQGLDVFGYAIQNQAQSLAQ